MTHDVWRPPRVLKQANAECVFHALTADQGPASLSCDSDPVLVLGVWSSCTPRTQARSMGSCSG
eukprot:196800-Prorocentrum_lima.AAC.1